MKTSSLGSTDREKPRVQAPDRAEIIGYVSKDSPLVGHIYTEPMTGEILVDNVYKRKGQASDWTKDAWPPRRVKITIEPL